MISEKESCGTFSQSDFKMRNYSTHLLTRKGLGALIGCEWMGDMLVRPKQRWGMCCLRHFLLWDHRLSYNSGQSRALGSYLVLTLENTHPSLCQNRSLQPWDCSWISYNALLLFLIRWRQCKHQCHLMSCDASSLVPGNNILLSSTIQRLILAWSLWLLFLNNLIIIF